MTVETPQELRGLLAAGRVVAEALRAMQEALCAGITTAELDQIAADVMAAHGARSAPVVAYNYPAMTCISINEEAAHGIPGNRQIQPGDLVSLDVSVDLDGYVADAAVTVAVPPVSPRVELLLACAREASQAALAAAQADAPLYEIGRAAEAAARRRGFRVIGSLSGHGLGRRIHEEPTVPNVFLRHARQPLHEGLVLAIEPHISAGSPQIVEQANGWTLSTRDHSPVAVFEHTVVISRGQPLIITA